MGGDVVDVDVAGVDAGGEVGTFQVQVAVTGAEGHVRGEVVGQAGGEIQAPAPVWSPASSGASSPVSSETQAAPMPPPR